LEADLYDETPRDATQVFSFLEQKVATIRDSLVPLRSIVTPYNGTYRTGAVVADAGYTQLVFVFPSPEHILPTLKSLDEFRSVAPLGHPAWNALFLETALLLLHPFQDGNGRTARALTDYEL
jgi:hypothetical protein